MRPIVLWVFIITLIAMADRMFFVIFPNYLLERQFSGLEIGLVFSLSALALIFARIFIGRLSDFYGRKKILACGFLGQAAAVSVFPFASKIHEFIILRGVKDASETAATSTEDAMLADTFPKKERAKALSRLGAAMPTGRVFGALVGFIATSYLALAHGFFIASALIFAALLLLLFFQKETSAKISQLSFHVTGKIKMVALIAFLISFNYAIAYMPAFFVLTKSMGIETSTLFLLFMGGNAISLPFAYSSGRWMKKIGAKSLAVVSAAVFSLAILLYPFAANIVVLFALLAIVSCSFYIWRIAFKVLLMNSTSMENRGGEIGFVKLFQGIGDVAGPVIGGLLLDANILAAPFTVAFASGMAAIFLTAVFKAG